MQIDETAHFVAKWLAREPEMQFAELFCPPDQKLRFRAWGALLHELREALFELSDARVTGVKLGWWAEEMFNMEQGAQRHPLTSALAGSAAPWRALGRALPAQAGIDERPVDANAAIDQLLPIARAVLAVEAGLFDSTVSPEAERSLSVHWLLQRLPRGLASEDQARIPMHLLARHGATIARIAAGEDAAVLRDWAGELADCLPERLPGAALITRSRHRFDKARLLRLAAGRGFTEAAPVKSLWHAWQAARNR